MNPTWNNAQQQPGDFIKNFQNWRDEIYNYENSATEIDSSMKLALLLRQIQGDIKSYLLLNANLAKADFDDIATKVEEYSGMSTSTTTQLEEYKHLENQ
eukprot:6042083-Amphidinium_carterae.1